MRLPNRHIIFGVIFLTLAGSVSAASAFYGEPPNEHYPWAVHDRNRPQPPRVEPAESHGAPPSDAVILFDGTQQSFDDNWRYLRPPDKRKGAWQVVDGALRVSRGAGPIGTHKEWGDCQLHIEWAAPVEIEGNGQKRGNSGVFLMGKVEVQVLDNYENPTYVDGMAGAIYGLMPPAANALRPPGQWQSYDIIFRRPIVRDGEMLDPGSITVLCNGVVIQDSTPIYQGGGHMKRKPSNHVLPELGPLTLQDHGNPVRFRNIWYRPLRPRALEGSTDGRLSPKATLAKRAEIAAAIRAEAANKEGLDKATLLLESLVYEHHDETLAEADAIVSAYLERVRNLPKAEQEGEKNTVLHFRRAYNYLQKYNILPASNTVSKDIRSLVQANGWNKKK